MKRKRDDEEKKEEPTTPKRRKIEAKKYKYYIAASVLSAILNHAFSDNKNEIIGLLGGKVDHIKEEVVITHTYSAVRDLKEIGEFAVATTAEEQINSLQYFNNKQVTNVGWYHSHPNLQPTPSITDINMQKLYQQYGNHILGIICTPYFIVKDFEMETMFNFFQVVQRSDEEMLALQLKQEQLTTPNKNNNNSNGNLIFDLDDDDDTPKLILPNQQTSRSSVRKEENPKNNNSSFLSNVLHAQSTESSSDKTTTTKINLTGDNSNNNIEKKKSKVISRDKVVSIEYEILEEEVMSSISQTEIQRNLRTILHETKLEKNKLFLKKASVREKYFICSEYHSFLNKFWKESILRNRNYLRQDLRNLKYNTHQQKEKISKIISKINDQSPSSSNDSNSFLSFLEFSKQKSDYILFLKERQEDQKKRTTSFSQKKKKKKKINGKDKYCANLPPINTLNLNRNYQPSRYDDENSNIIPNLNNINSTKNNNRNMLSYQDKVRLERKKVLDAEDLAMISASTGVHQDVHNNSPIHPSSLFDFNNHIPSPSSFPSSVHVQKNGKNKKEEEEECEGEDDNDNEKKEEHHHSMETKFEKYEELMINNNGGPGLDDEKERKESEYPYLSTRDPDIKKIDDDIEKILGKKKEDDDEIIVPPPNNNNDNNTIPDTPMYFIYKDNQIMNNEEKSIINEKEKDKKKQIQMNDKIFEQHQPENNLFQQIQQQEIIKKKDFDDDDDDWEKKFSVLKEDIISRESNRLIFKRIIVTIRSSSSQQNNNGNDLMIDEDKEFQEIQYHQNDDVEYLSEGRAREGKIQAFLYKLGQGENVVCTRFDLQVPKGKKVKDLTEFKLIAKIQEIGKESMFVPVTSIISKK